MPSESEIEIGLEDECLLRMSQIRIPEGVRIVVHKLRLRFRVSESDGLLQQFVESVGGCEVICRTDIPSFQNVQLQHFQHRKFFCLGNGPSTVFENRHRVGVTSSISPGVVGIAYRSIWSYSHCSINRTSTARERVHRRHDLA